MATKPVERSVSFIEGIKARHVDEFFRYGTGVPNFKKLASIFAETIAECSFTSGEITADELYELNMVDFKFVMNQFTAYVNELTSKN